MKIDVFKILRYSFFLALAMFVIFVISFLLIFNTFYVVEEVGAIPTGENLDKSPWDVDINTGYLYLKNTTTPSLGRRGDRGVIYSKANCKLYFLYDKTGETEKEVALIDNGTLLVTNIGDSRDYITRLYATAGNITNLNTTTAEITTVNADAINSATAVITTINNTTLNTQDIFTTNFEGIERSSDPANPEEGHFKVWMSNGEGNGDDGDIMIKVQAGGIVATGFLVDVSSL